MFVQIHSIEQELRESLLVRLDKRTQGRPYVNVMVLVSENLLRNRSEKAVSITYDGVHCSVILYEHDVQWSRGCEVHLSRGSFHCLCSALGNALMSHNRQSNPLATILALSGDMTQVVVDESGLGLPIGRIQNMKCFVS